MQRCDVRKGWLLAELAHLIEYLLSVMGLTVLIVWPQDGPGAWVRDRALRPRMPGKIGEVLDCCICLSFWLALGFSTIYWWLYRERWCWFGCFMTPAVFWLVLRGNR
jgi:hypothetical protein